MCGYPEGSWQAYQLAWTRDKLEAAEHTIESYEAELVRDRKFLAEENKTRSPGITYRRVRYEIDHA